MRHSHAKTPDHNPMVLILWAASSRTELLGIKGWRPLRATIPQLLPAKSLLVLILVPMAFWLQHRLRSWSMPSGSQVTS